MDRLSFLKNSALLGLAPVLLNEILDVDQSKIIVENHKKKRVAIDLSAIQNIGGKGGRTMEPADIIKIYLETGVLIYRTPHGAHEGFKPIHVIDE